MRKNIIYRKVGNGLLVVRVVIMRKVGLHSKARISLAMRGNKGWLLVRVVVMGRVGIHSKVRISLGRNINKGGR